MGSGELVFGVFWEMLSFHVVHVCIGSDLFVQISGFFHHFIYCPTLVEHIYLMPSDDYCF